MNILGASQLVFAILVGLGADSLLLGLAALAGITAVEALFDELSKRIEEAIKSRNAA